MDHPPAPFIGTGWLRQHLLDPDLAVLDVRWSLAGGADHDAYLSGHVPGARFVDLDRELAGPPGPGGRHPLPDPGSFAEAMRRAGVGARGRVVCYDAGTAAAARAWWLLRAAGHPGAMVLDGGFEAWRRGGGEIEAGPGPGVGSGDFQAQAFAGQVSADQLARLIRGGRLALDARAADRFRGQPSPLDPRPGHVPGAGSLPWTDLYREGRVLDPESVRRRLGELGERPPAAAYCGSGVTACALILALESSGLDPVLLYPGSWSEWAQDPARTVELGD